MQSTVPQIAATEALALEKLQRGDCQRTAREGPVLAKAPPPALMAKLSEVNELEREQTLSELLRGNPVLAELVRNCPITANQH